jgi:hypothetical protein
MVKGLKGTYSLIRFGTCMYETIQLVHLIKIYSSCQGCKKMEIYNLYEVKLYLALLPNLLLFFEGYFRERLGIERGEERRVILKAVQQAVSILPSKKSKRGKRQHKQHPVPPAASATRWPNFVAK